MWWMFFCPSCKAPVANGHRFCSNCGVKFDWLIPKPSPHNQSVVHINQSHSPRFHIDDNHDAVMQHKNQQGGRVTTPIRTEILNLINELFNK